jgi:hypothetical protein
MLSTLDDMLLMSAGVVVMILTVVVFIAMLPRGGKLHRFANTEWESYIGVAFCSATALGVTMMLAGLLNVIGNP